LSTTSLPKLWTGYLVTARIPSVTVLPLHHLQLPQTLHLLHTCFVYIYPSACPAKTFNPSSPLLSLLLLLWSLLPAHQLHSPPWPNRPCQFSTLPALRIQDDMSILRSSSSPSSPSMEPEEPRKKGARGGKRSVTHLSKAQLARKRANDREAQRNIRQRTKEHIENLEKKVKELEEFSRASSMERVLARNRELEDEIERLRSHMSVKSSPAASVPPNHRDVPEEILMPQKVQLEWMPNSNPTWSQASIPPHIPLQPESSVSSPYSKETQTYPTSNGYPDDEAEAGQHIYTQAAQPTQAIPIWDDQIVCGPQAAQTQNLTKPAPSRTPFHPALSQPSRFADLQQEGYADVISNQNAPYHWQSQPSICAWQIGTKVRAPATQVDHLMMSAIPSQRQVAMTSRIGGEDLVGPDIPPVHMLFDHPGPSKPANLAEVMVRSPPSCAYTDSSSGRSTPLTPPIDSYIPGKLLDQVSCW